LLPHHSQEEEEEEINTISRQKYPQTPKKRRDLPPHRHLLVVNLILFYRFDVIIEFSIFLLFFFILFFIFLFSSIGTGISSYSSCSHSPSFPSQSFTIIDPVAGKTFAICHFDRHLFSSSS
jgi:hypothetical protein